MLTGIFIESVAANSILRKRVTFFSSKYRQKQSAGMAHVKIFLIKSRYTECFVKNIVSEIENTHVRLFAGLAEMYQNPNFVLLLHFGATGRHK